MSASLLLQGCARLSLIIEVTHDPTVLMCMQAARPRAIVDLIRSAEDFRIDLGKEGGAVPQPRKCERCGYICSQAVCKACLLLEGLNKGLPSMGISRPRQVNNRAAAKSAALAVKKQGGSVCQGDGAVVEEMPVRGHQPCKGDGVGNRGARQGGCCGEKMSCGGDQQLAARIADVQDTMDHLVQEDEDSQTQSAQLVNAAQQSGHANGHADSARGATSHDTFNVTDGAQVCDYGQQGLQSGQPQLTDSRGLQSGQARTNGKAELKSLSKLDLAAKQPMHVHGKQYENNLREVEAHPSARHRPLRADFDTSW